MMKRQGGHACHMAKFDTKLTKPIHRKLFGDETFNTARKRELS